MSYRYANAIIKPGLNTLVAPTPDVYTRKLFSWGRNLGGPLGLGNQTYYSSPKQVGALTNWLKISSGYNFSVSTKIDGTLWAWGQNNYGQLGQSNITYRSSPVQVGALTTWATVSAGGFHVLAIQSNGTLWSWGKNTNGGQLGIGNTNNYSSPMQIGTLSTWLSVAAGGYVSSAIKTDGTLWTWGYNPQGQLGDGSTVSKSSPVQIGTLTNWLRVAASKYSVIAVKKDGTFWSWGQNNYGQLGLGNQTYYSSPKQVGALTTWNNIAVANFRGYVSLATKIDGTLWSWGNGSTGSLGLGNTTSYSSPKQVGALTTWLTVAASTYCSFSIKTDGTLWSWGNNSDGILGLGNTTNYSSPKQVGALTSWGNANCGTNFAAILQPTLVTPKPYTQYTGIWKLNAASAAKGAGTWP